MHFAHTEGQAGHLSSREKGTRIAIGIAGMFFAVGCCVSTYKLALKSSYHCQRDTVIATLLHLSYLITGVALTLGQTSLATQGLVFAQTGLLVFPSYLGAALAFPLLFRRAKGRRFDKGFVAVAVFDLAANVFGMASVVMAGGQIFMLTFSSITVLTALLKLCLMRVNQTARQWVALFVILIGLLLNGKAATSAGAQMEEGVVCGLLAAAGFALCFVVAEAVLTNTNAPPGEAMCAYVGLQNSGLLAVYIAFYTAPRWQELVSDPVADSGTGTYASMVSAYALTTVSLCAHQLSFYTLQNYGSGQSVACGVNKAAQTVSVFIAADLCFCTEEDDRACFTVTKFESLIAVVVGVCAYALVSKDSPKAEVATEEEARGLVGGDDFDDYADGYADGKGSISLRDYN